MFQVQSRNHLFAISNFIAALGGGLILGKGMDAIQINYLENGSILAFFVGTILGLIFIQFIPKKISGAVAQWFALNCAVTSCMLLFLFQHDAHAEKLTGLIGIIFFVFLSIRFSFWFYSRVMRVAQVANQQQSIAWIEFGYYLGMVLGLIFWKLLDLNLTLSTALIIDISFQCLAGILDLLSYRAARTKLSVTSSGEIVQSSSGGSLSWCWRLLAAGVFLTMAIQVIIFNLSHLVAESFGVYVLAVFYLGVAMAALLNNRYQISIHWFEKNNFAYIAMKNGQIKLPLFPLMLSTGGLLLLMIELINKNLSTLPILLYALVFIAALVYEMVLLAILEHIAHEEKQLTQNNFIMKTYGFMGVGAASLLMILGLCPNQWVAMLWAMTVCLLLALILIARRSFAPPSLALEKEIL